MMQHSMKRKFLFRLTVVSLLLLLSPASLSARQCYKCHGLGKMTVFPAIATYGISDIFQVCPICQRRVRLGSEHKERCDVCNGTGHISSAIESQREERNNDAQAEALSYLSPEELSLFLALQEQLKGHEELVPCQTCHQTGNCIACNGMRYVGNDFCHLCQGTGMCTICYGTKYGGKRYVEPTEEQRRQTLEQMGQLLGQAFNRAHGIGGDSTATPNADSDTDNYSLQRSNSSLNRWFNFRVYGAD